MLKLKLFIYLTCFLMNTAAFATKSNGLNSESITLYDYSEPFHKHAWLVAHNAYSNDNIFSNQYGLSITDQLNFGVRGFMLDIYDGSDGIYLCHKNCFLSNYGKFFDAISYSILPFLRENPREIITVFLEDHSSRDLLEKELKKIHGLNEIMFHPQTWVTHTNWPTLDELIAQNQRLFIITDKKENAGYYEMHENEVHLIHGQDISVENYWSLGDTHLTHNYSCTSRWPHIPLRTKKASVFYNEWDRLVVMNQFHGIPFYPHSETDNKFRALMLREQKYCNLLTERLPNYVAVDNVTSGQAKEYVQWLNTGGILFFKSASNEIDELNCGIAINENKLVELKKINCSNKTSFLQLNKLVEGTKIKLLEKNYTIINREFAEIVIKKTFLKEEYFFIDSNNSSDENQYFSYTYYGNKTGEKKFTKIHIQMPQ